MKDIETGSFVTQPIIDKWPETIRIVSWNINRGMQLDQVKEFLASASADLILLQEVDVNARRTHRRNIAWDIAHALRMNYVFGCEFEELAQGNRTDPAYHGQATLSRFSLSHPQILSFRRQSTFWHPRWFIPRLQAFQRRLGARMALICDLTVEGRTLVLCNAHLESRGDDELRSDQLSEVLASITQNSAQTQVLLAGDFNFDLSRQPAAALIAGMQLDNPFARLGGRPTARNGRHAKCAAIDWILTGGTLSTSDPEIHDSIGASDHYPLSLQLKLQ